MVEVLPQPTRAYPGRLPVLHPIWWCRRPHPNKSLHHVLPPICLNDGRYCISFQGQAKNHSHILHGDGGLSTRQMEGMCLRPPPIDESGQKSHIHHREVGTNNSSKRQQPGRWRKVAYRSSRLNGEWECSLSGCNTWNGNKCALVARHRRVKAI